MTMSVVLLSSSCASEYLDDGDRFFSLSGRDVLMGMKVEN